MLGLFFLDAFPPFEVLIAIADSLGGLSLKSDVTTGALLPPRVAFAVTIAPLMPSSDVGINCLSFSTGSKVWGSCAGESGFGRLGAAEGLSVGEKSSSFVFRGSTNTGTPSTRGLGNVKQIRKPERILPALTIFAVASAVLISSSFKVLC